MKLITAILLSMVVASPLAAQQSPVVVSKPVEEHTASDCAVETTIGTAAGLGFGAFIGISSAILFAIPSGGASLVLLPAALGLGALNGAGIGLVVGGGVCAAQEYSEYTTESE